MLGIIPVPTFNAVYARETVEFELCHHKTGEATGHVILDGVRTKGKAPIYTDQVQLVMPLVNDKCTLIVLQSSNQAYVIGSYREVLCKLHGGQNCTVEGSDKQE